MGGPSSEQGVAQPTGEQEVAGLASRLEHRAGALLWVVQLLVWAGAHVCSGHVERAVGRL